jgi:hypothetical protein
MAPYGFVRVHATSIRSVSPSHVRRTLGLLSDQVSLCRTLTSPAGPAPTVTVPSGESTTPLQAVARPDRGPALYRATVTPERSEGHRTRQGMGMTAENAGAVEVRYCEGWDPER